MKSIQHKRNQVPQLQIFYLVGRIGQGSTCLTSRIQFLCAYYGVFGRSGIVRLLTTWIVPKIKCLLLLVKLYLIGFRLGGSQLVIFSLLFLVLLLFCNKSAAQFSFVSFLFFPFLVNAGLLNVFHAQSSLLYIIILKKIKLN